MPSLGPAARKASGSTQNGQFSPKSTQGLVRLSQSSDALLPGPPSSSDNSTRNNRTLSRARLAGLSPGFEALSYSQWKHEIQQEKSLCRAHKGYSSSRPSPKREKDQTQQTSAQVPFPGSSKTFPLTQSPLVRGPDCPHKSFL